MLLARHIEINNSRIVLIKKNILQKLEAHLRAGAHLWFAYSGGLDSSALLHFLRREFASSPYADRFTAIHVHHGLSPFADTWLELCRDNCEKWGVALEVRHVHIENQGAGLESAARDARYEVFKQLMGAGDILMTAHHAGDQAETFLYRLARGAGLDGLLAMQEWRPFGSGALWRPALWTDRAELAQYAKKYALHWADDESNHDVRFDRNFLRARALPVFAERWPLFGKSVLKTTQLLAESRQLLDEYAQMDLLACGREPRRLGEALSLAALQAFSKPRQRAVLRYWIRANGFSLPERKLFDEFDKLMAAKEEASPEVCWGQYVLRRFGGELYLCPKIGLPTEQAFSWDGVSNLHLGDGFVLTCDVANRPGDYVVRFREPGLRARPETRAHSQTLKKLLQEYKIEPWLRGHVPLIFSGEQLVAAADLFRCADTPDSALRGLRWIYTGKNGAGTKTGEISD